MKRRVRAVLAVALAGLVLLVAPAAAQDGYGHVERNEWNVPLTGIRLL
ncbi:hypothetical protein QQY66_26945 [Streptomyces sp. DG2A-72]|nr:hypothetical protein [Streptomyces sp. DG2A-72]MDO0935128.1 hypothetical protein [Streptomyces sp. DG2A-72]